MTDAALAQVVEGAPAQVIDLPNGHPGVAGIVAARVMEKLGGNVPVCVIADGRGSARSPQWLNVRDALESCSDLLDGFGGHAAAAGFSVMPGKVCEFRERLCRYCLAAMAEGDVAAQAEPKPDMWVEARELTTEVALWLRRLEPFGEGNPEPVFAFRGATISDVRPLGYDGKHLSLAANGLRGVWWGHGDEIEGLRAGSHSPHDVFFTVGISEYGERHVEMRVKAMRLTEGLRG